MFQSASDGATDKRPAKQYESIDEVMIAIDSTTPTSLILTLTVSNLIVVAAGNELEMIVITSVRQRRARAAVVCCSHSRLIIT